MFSWCKIKRIVFKCYGLNLLTFSIHVYNIFTHSSAALSVARHMRFTVITNRNNWTFCAVFCNFCVDMISSLFELGRAVCFVFNICGDVTERMCPPPVVSRDTSLLSILISFICKLLISLLSLRLNTGDRYAERVTISSSCGSS